MSGKWFTMVLFYFPWFFYSFIAFSFSTINSACLFNHFVVCLCYNPFLTLFFFLSFFSFSQAFCEEGNIAENGVLSFCKFVLYPIMELKGQKGIYRNCQVFCYVLIFVSLNQTGNYNKNQKNIYTGCSGKLVLLC